MMRQIRPAVLLAAVISSAILLSPGSALAGSAHHKKAKHHKKTSKKAALKDGTYKMLFTSGVTAGQTSTMTLTSAKVSLSPATNVTCKGVGLNVENGLGGFVTPVALSASGSVTEHAPASAETEPGAPPQTGQATFSVTFTKQGTASGYVEESLSSTFANQPTSCTSGKQVFSAKLR